MFHSYIIEWEIIILMLCYYYLVYTLKKLTEPFKYINFSYV